MGQKWPDLCSAAYRTPLDRRQSVVCRLVAFAAFSFCSSSAYVLNDLLDLDADRCHSSKKTRPFAAGISR